MANRLLQHVLIFREHKLMYVKHRFLIVFASVFACLNQTISIADAKRSNEQLNVVFILVDDLGWTDIACMGSDFHE